MDQPADLIVGPVAEAVGVSRSWLLGSEAPLQEPLDLPVSLLLELMDAADSLYPTEQQRWRQLRQWLSRISGRPSGEFDQAAPLLTAVRRRYRSCRDEDLLEVIMWRRLPAGPPPSAATQVELSVRPENGDKLRGLVSQLGSEQAAVDFLLQMEEKCGKSAALRRTRWPPKIQYESSRGQLKIDVGTEMVCVVLSQFKPAGEKSPQKVPVSRGGGEAPGGGGEVGERPGAPAISVQPTPLPTRPHQQQQETGEHTAAEVQGEGATPVLNGHQLAGSTPVPTATVTTTTVEPPGAPGTSAETPEPRPAPSTSGPAPLSLPPSVYQTVVRDATLPAQMFADDDTAPDVSDSSSQSAPESALTSSGGGAESGSPLLAGRGGPTLTEAVGEPMSVDSAMLDVVEQDVITEEVVTEEVPMDVTSE